MTQEEKQLVLQDICGRLPYGVIGLIRIANGNDYKISIVGGDIDLLSRHFITIKPYLRHMSSMTEEEEKEYMNIDNRSYSCPMAYAHIPASDRIDWLNKNMFDYRGLIEKGLAIEVTENNNPYKQS